MGAESDRKIRETFQLGEYARAALPNLPLRPPNRLTPSERAALALFWRGKSDDQIARERGLSVATVVNQVNSIRRKLGVESRDQLRELLGAPPR